MATSMAASGVPTGCWSSKRGRIDGFLFETGRHSPLVAACHVQVNCLDQPMISERDISLPLDAAVLQRIAEPASSKSAESDDRKPKVPNETLSLRDEYRNS
jgi:hypothetical protein